MRKVTVKFNFEQNSSTDGTVKAINLDLGENHRGFDEI